MRWLSYQVFTLLGWRVRGTLSDEFKMVIIAAPHTSNWDFFLFLATIQYLDIQPKFLGKHTLFRWPFGWMFRKVGGIPVDRSQTGGIVAQVKRAFDERERMILVITPEGTRKASSSWKSGFVEIAEGANVPVVFAGVDGSAKTITISPPEWVGSDRGEFMDRVRNFYQDMPGLRPNDKGPVRLSRESPAS